METLDVPTNINIDKRIVTWDAVENATGYSVRFANVEYETVEPAFDLHFHGDGGTYEIKLKAIGDGKSYWSSDWSEAANITLSERVANGYDELGFRYTLLEDESGYEVNRGKANLNGYVTIPDYFGDYPVKRIAKRMFSQSVGTSGDAVTNYFTEEFCNTITTGVKLPSKLESIEASAFFASVRLEEIVIPDTVTNIGAYAFEGCTHLTRVVLPKNLKVIPQACFKNTALTEINLPDGLEEIGTAAFRCTYEEHHHIGSAVSSIVIPSSVKHISGHAFYGRENLANIVIPRTVEYIDSPFHETKWYENQPDGLLFIGEGNCFLYGYKGEIPDGVIDNIPAHVSGICGRAFFESNLRKITIPDDIKLIGQGVFERCSELSEVYLPSDLEVIPSSTFYMTHSLKGITLPATLTRICSSSFSESGLEKITIPGSCKTIERAAFAGCKMSEVVIEEGVESIETYAFNRTELKNLILPESLKNLGEDILNQNTHIQTVYIPASIEVFRCPVSKRNTALTHIYFGGDSAKWAEYIEESYSYAQNPEYAKSEGRYDFDCVYFYSEEKPEAPGNYWHYVDGKITVWTFE